MNKILNIVLNILMMITLFAIAAVLIIGGFEVSIFGFKIFLSSVIGLFRCFLIFYLIKILFKSDKSKIESFFHSVFPKLQKSKNSNSRIAIFPSVYLFLIAGLVMAFCDGFLDSFGILHKITMELSANSSFFQTLSSIATSRHQAIFVPLSPSYIYRLERVSILVLFYGFGSFLAGVIVLKMISFFRDKAKIFSSINPFILSMNISIIVSVSLLSVSAGGFDILSNDPYGPLNLIDSFAIAIIVFFLFYCIPKNLFDKKIKMILLAFIPVVLIISAYCYFDYQEENSLKVSAGKTHSRVVLITIDTTRADHLSAYGYERNTTPNLKQIASEGVLFSRVYSEMPTTDPSHTSIMTATYPRTHGLLKNGMSISNKRIDFLQTWFKNRGYTTAAITSRPHLNPEEMGWDKFDYTHIPYPRKMKYLRDSIFGRSYYRFVASNTSKRAREWVERNSDKDFFLWVHFWDPHWPYDPLPPFNSQYNSGYKGRIKKPYSFISDEDKYTPKQIQYTTSLYDGEISFADKYVGKLISYIENRFVDSDAAPLFVITSDHGDSLAELQDEINYVFDHSETLHNGQMQVPLIIKWKGVLPQGKRIDELVESVDIAPTIVELLNAPDSFPGDGKSFAPLIFDDVNYIPKDAVFGQRRLYTKHPVDFVNVPENSVTTKNWRLIVNKLRGIELYDALNDPDEENNLAQMKPDIVELLLGKLEKWKKQFPPISIKEEELSNEKIEVLKSLGYMQ